MENAHKGAFLKLSDLLLNVKNRVELIPPDAQCAKTNSEFYQANEQTAFGMLINQSGGAVVEGVVRLLGSTADPNYRDIKAFNEQFGGNGFVILGDDIFGGIFALNMGMFPECVGNVIYFAPDTLEFEDMEIKLSHFFEFLRNNDLSDFYGLFSVEEYESLRARNVPFNKVLSFTPPQWSAEFATEKLDVREIDIYEYYRLQTQQN